MKHFILYTLVGILLLYSGCRQERARPDGMPPLHPCRLVLTQAEIPLQNATVTLRSTIPGYRWSIGGRTGSDGNVDLLTNGFFRGAPEGIFKVIVEKNVRNQSVHLFRAGYFPVMMLNRVGLHTQLAA